MTYPPHQMLTPEQQAKMDAQNAPQPKVTKKEAMQALDDARAMLGMEYEIDREWYDLKIKCLKAEIKVLKSIMDGAWND